MYGAGDGNRTHNNSLEGCGFTTKLHPQIFLSIFKSLIQFLCCKLSSQRTNFLIIHSFFGIVKLFLLNYVETLHFQVTKLLHFFPKLIDYQRVIASVFTFSTGLIPILDNGKIALIHPFI